ncbi:NAD-glutamate dehydrogenase domain-containing protein [Streptomyces griseorubiginosus]|uniref:NAD-glutamate dehydrogenase domain-containing protein n=1 Tax=Streptomyces griseorubiginosus TaxID=67304 RepID=UPI0036855254
MQTKLDEAKAELLERAAGVAENSPVGGRLPPGAKEEGTSDRDTVLAFLQRYYLRAAPEDLGDRDPVDIFGAALSHYRLAENRPQGTASVRVHTPTVEENGWTCSHSLVEVVTDDMPFLVDSVNNELARQGRGIHVVIYPQIVVRRDVTGKLIEVLSAPSGGKLPNDAHIESWIHVEIDRETDRGDLKQITADLLRVLSDVREAVEDWDKMRDAALRMADELPAEPVATDLRDSEIEEARELLRWLSADHFTFLGFREYQLREDDSLAAVPGTGLGILRSDPQHAGDESHPVSPSFERLPPGARAKAREHKLLVLTKANSRATVHRPSYLDYIGVKKFDADGNVVGERRFLGLFSSAAYTESVRRVPVIRRKVDEVLERAGLSPNSRDGRDLLQILETYPRDELFQIPAAELESIATSVFYLQKRRRLRLYLRQDEYGRYYSALIYLPRDRYTTRVRLRIIDILKEELAGISVDFTAWNTESILSRLHFVVRVPQGTELLELSDVDIDRIQVRLVEAARSWVDGFAEALYAECGEVKAAELLQRYRNAFPEGYKAEHTGRAAVADLVRLEHLAGQGGNGFSLHMYEPVGAVGGERRFKIYRLGAAISLSDVLPVLNRLGVEVVDHRPYELLPVGRAGVWIYDFGVRSDAALRDLDGDERLQEAFAAVWTGRAEDDSFNSLVVHARITWREAMMMRVYAKYWRQLGPVFSQESMAAALRNHPHATRLLVSLFEARMSPERQRAGMELSDALQEELDGALDQVASPDEARILRSFLTFIKATLRTNFFQEAEPPGKPHEYVSMKFDPQAIPDVPAPRPMYEIWVYSPRVEGTYLRFAQVARGGPLWLERREDFRAEVLRRAGAQMVGNLAAVPIGAKGGFVAKQLPDPGTDRDAWLAEGIACYTIFVSGLLDITDNIVAGEVVPPRDVVRHDADDTYVLPSPELQGRLPYEAACSSYQEVATARYYWLRNPLAMHAPLTVTITARGTWEAVRVRFHELGRDADLEPVTVMGSGSASGDVFSAVLLLSPQVRLLAAFDDDHFFFDPAPHAASAYAERRRLAAVPGSSWGDYDVSLISAGGGVHSRRDRRIRVSKEVRQLLGLPDDAARVSPHELTKAILEAQADLLLLGGHGVLLGTRAELPVKLADQGTVAWADVGATSAAVIGELADDCMTPAAREAYALRGGRIGLPAADAVARSMAEDMRTNLAIAATALDFRQGSPDGAARELAASSARKAIARAARLHRLVALEARQSHMGLTEHLRAVAVGLRGTLKPPDREEIEQRRAEGRGLTLPELTLLVVQAHGALRDAALEAGMPPAGWKRELLERYFKGLPDDDHRMAVAMHPLRDSIAASEMAWRLLEELGPARPYSLAQLAGGSLSELVAAFVACRGVLGATRTRRRKGDRGLAQPAETAVGLARRRAVSGALLWLLLKHPLDAYPGATLPPQSVSDLWAPHARAVAGTSADDLLAIGVPGEQAQNVWLLGCMGFALDARALAARTEEPPAEVVLRYARLLQRHNVTAAVTAGLAALQSEESAVRHTEALSSIRRDLLLRVALDGPPGGEEWRNKAMESIFRTPGPVMGALAPEIAASLAGIQADLTQQLQIPSTGRAPAAPIDTSVPDTGEKQGNLMNAGNEASP